MLEAAQASGILPHDRRETGLKRICRVRGRTLEQRCHSVYGQGFVEGGRDSCRASDVAFQVWSVDKMLRFLHSRETTVVPMHVCTVFTRVVPASDTLFSPLFPE